ncbi:MAG: response regulator [Sphaerospermopsis sp. SIO1G2]|nr:response regulator [Sphaerospermopsis sp. SIO1G2]
MPIVAISIFDDSVRAKSLGADDYLVRPINQEKICQTINQLFADNLFLHCSNQTTTQFLHTNYINTPLNTYTPENQAHLILIAEDNQANITTIFSYLNAKGYQLIMARNGQEAVDMTFQNNPSLIIMDIQMPGINGLEAMRIIRANVKFKYTPIIALTALAMTGDKEKCIAAGANEYMAKPVKLKLLIKTVQQLLDPEKYRI